MKKTIAWKITITSVLLAILLIAGCGSGSESADPSGRTPAGFAAGAGAVFPVKAELVVRKSISQYIVTNTTLEAERWIDVLAKSSGLVTGVLVEEGALVTTGNVLARLERKEIEIELQEAKLDLGNAAKSFERTSNLRQQKMIGDEEYEKAQYQLEASRLRLQKAELSLANTEITSPIEGVVTTRNINVGQTISQNQTVFRVGDFDPLLAYIYVPERDLGKIRAGQRVVIYTESFPDEEFEAAVKRISPVVEAASGTGKITIEVSTTDRKLKPGMFVKVYLAVLTHGDALVIPKKAVVIEREQYAVFVAREGTAVRTPVEQGLSEGDYVEILSGLNEGDRIITVGQESLQDGSAVRIVGEAVASAPGTGGGQNPGDSEGGSRAPAARDAPEPGSGGPGGFDLNQMPPDRLKMIEERLMSSPDVKKEYESRLEKDPELAKDQEKKIAFLQEMMQQYGMGGRQ